MSKTTEELMNEIQQFEQVEDFLSENGEETCRLSLSEYLKAKLEERKLKKADLFRKAGLVGSNYGYELFQNDHKVPSRDILLSICLAFPLSIEETQHALRCCGLAVLYPRNIRDAYILFAIKNKMTIDELNDLLTENGHQTLL